MTMEVNPKPIPFFELLYTALTDRSARALRKGNRESAESINPEMVAMSLTKQYKAPWLAVQLQRQVENPINSVKPIPKDKKEQSTEALVPRNGFEPYGLGMRRNRNEQVLQPTEIIIVHFEFASQELTGFVRRHQNDDFIGRLDNALYGDEKRVTLPLLYEMERMFLSLRKKVGINLLQSQEAASYRIRTHEIIRPNIETLEYNLIQAYQSYSLPDKTERREQVLYEPVALTWDNIPRKLRDGGKMLTELGKVGDAFVHLALEVIRSYDYSGYENDENIIGKGENRWVPEPTIPPHTYVPNKVRGRMLRKRIWGS